MTMMRAIHIEDNDDKSLTWLATNRPEPEPGEVLIKVAATAVNRADLVQRTGNYPPPPGASPILGLEASGHVTALGDGVEGVEIGDAVCVLLTGGGYAEYVTAPASLLMPVPENLSLIEAASLPEVYFTAWVNLFMEAGAKSGDVVMLHAAASGVGTAAIQLCKAHDIEVIATASGSKLEFLQDLGADHVIDRKTEDFVERVRAITNNRGVDIILDPVGQDYLGKNIASLASKGRLVSIGLLSGRKGELDMGRVLVKRLRLIGSVLRSRAVEEKLEIAAQLREKAWPLFDTGELRPVIHGTMAIEQAQKAHELIASNTTIGKVVLTIGEEARAPSPGRAQSIL